MSSSLVSSARLASTTTAAAAATAFVSSPSSSSSPIRLLLSSSPTAAAANILSTNIRRKVTTTKPPIRNPPWSSSSLSNMFWIRGGGSDINNNNNIVARSMSSTTNNNNEPFKTWTFDKPCETMDWTPSPKAVLSLSKWNPEDSESDSDLTILGILAPGKDNDDEEEDDDNNSKDDDDDVEITLTGALAQLDGSMEGALKDFLIEISQSFKNGAKAGSLSPTLRIVNKDGKIKRYAFLGLGPDNNNKDLETDAIMKIGKAIATKCIKEKKVAKCTVLFPSKLHPLLLETPSSSMLSLITSSFYTNLYADNRFRTGDKKQIPADSLETVTLSIDNNDNNTDIDLTMADSIIKSAKSIALGIFLAKDIVNAPHNVLNSLSMANVARRIANESNNGCIKCKILDKKECEKRNMGAFLGVARGSETEPQFIHLIYTPKSTTTRGGGGAGDIKKKIGIVGKGLLFDTGGYNIKTQMMEQMKFDCGGSAAVLGAARAIADLQPDGVEAHFIVAATENMINEKAYVASDVLTASNGKTIEVLNTDAEGRLTLADAIIYADKEIGCEKIIELSTLTGACMIALGKSLAGFWTKDETLAKELNDISTITGDKSWRMPLASLEYNDQLESKVADIKNVGTKYGGAITAALFLENFVNKKKPFAHIDMAGPVWSDKGLASGFGAKLVTEWVCRQGREEEGDGEEALK